MEESPFFLRVRFSDSVRFLGQKTGLSPDPLMGFDASFQSIDVRKGVLGGLNPPLILEIWADPPSWKIFEQVTP